MGISLVTFAGSTVTSQDDALIYESALLGSGLIYGGTVTIKNANTLHVAAAHGAICGRKFTIDETDIAVSLTASGSLDGRLYIHMDLSDTDEPISLLVETAETLTPVVQDQNVNIINGVYEINMATFTVDTSTLDNLDNVAPVLSSVISALSNKYGTDDTAETTIDDADYFPFYDSSATAKRKSLWSNIKAVLKTYFDTLYATITYVDNKHIVTRKTVDTSSWSSDTTSQSGTTLYKKSISLSHVYVDSPSVEISTSDGTGLPTAAQQTAYNLLQYVTVDGTTMYLYASAVPTTTFYINIEGVD